MFKNYIFILLKYPYIQGFIALYSNTFHHYVHNTAQLCHHTKNLCPSCESSPCLLLATGGKCMKIPACQLFLLLTGNPIYSSPQLQTKWTYSRVLGSDLSSSPGKIWPLVKMPYQVEQLREQRTFWKWVQSCHFPWMYLLYTYCTLVVGGFNVIMEKDDWGVTIMQGS